MKNYILSLKDIVIYLLTFFILFSCKRDNLGEDIKKNDILTLDTYTIELIPVSDNEVSNYKLGEMIIPDKSSSLVISGILPATLFAAAHAKSVMSKRYVLKFPDEFSKGLKNGTYSMMKSAELKGALRACIINKKTGEIIGQPNILQVSPSTAFKVGFTIWNILAIVTATHFLSEIDSKLENIQNGINDIKTIDQNNKLGEIFANFQAIQRYQKEIFLDGTNSKFEEYYALINSIINQTQSISNTMLLNQGTLLNKVEMLRTNSVDDIQDYLTLIPEIHTNQLIYLLSEKCKLYSYSMYISLKGYNYYDSASIDIEHTKYQIYSRKIRNKLIKKINNIDFPWTQDVWNGVKDIGGSIVNWASAPINETLEKFCGINLHTEKPKSDNDYKKLLKKAINNSILNIKKQENELKAASMNFRETIDRLSNFDNKNLNILITVDNDGNIHSFQEILNFNI